MYSANESKMAAELITVIDELCNMKRTEHIERPTNTFNSL